MFKKLQLKWKVGLWRLILILCTFALGGSLTGYLGRWVLLQLPIYNRTLSIILYVLIVTLIWPLTVLAVSLIFGQFDFFTAYLKRIGKRLTGRGNDKTPMVLFIAATIIY